MTYSVNFKTYAGIVQAVRGVSFELYEGETLAIVGESGSGKCVTSNALMKLIPQPPGIYAGGEIIFEWPRHYSSYLKKKC